MIEAKPRFDGAETNLYVRIGSDDGRLYFNLDDEPWRAVKNGVDGWRVITEPPVRFRRAAGMTITPRADNRQADRYSAFIAERQQ